jgi:hypothetical protein
VDICQCGDELTFDARHSTLLPSHTHRGLRSSAGCRRDAQNLPPRMRRATSANSRILCGDLSLCRIQKSKLSSTPRNERGSGRPLPAQRIKRGPFLPPCQSPPLRLTASPQSVIRRTETDLHRSMDYLWSPDYCSEKPVRQHSGTNETARPRHKYHSIRASIGSKSSRFRWCERSL